MTQANPRVRKLLIALVASALTIGCSGNESGGSDTGGTGGTDANGGDVTATDTAVDSVGGEDATADAATDAEDATGQDTGGGDDSSTDAGDDATVGDATADTGGGTDTVTAPDVDESKGLQSEELLVKILGPSGRDWVQSDSEFAQLAGVTFGAPDSLEWKSSSGETGTIDVAAYWVSGVVKLQPGDNTITVTAKQGSTTAVDTVHIVYNPFFTFEGAPQIAPDLLFVGESAKLVVRMPLSAAGESAAGKGPVNAATVKLIEVDVDGKLVKDHGALLDNGSASSCDDIQKDGYFSACLSLTPNVAKRLFFRVTADVEIFDKKYNALSPVSVVDVVNRFTQSECSAIVGLQKKIKGDAKSAISGGKTPEQAAADAVTAFKADATVADAGVSPSGYGVWVRYKTGRLGALNLAPAGMRAGAGAAAPGVSTAALPTYSVGTRRALTLAPAAAEFQAGFPAGEGDEAEFAAAGLAARECPPFFVDKMTGDKALLRYYRNIWQYGLVAITGHGDVYFNGLAEADAAAYGWEHLGAQEVVWSGEAADCSALSSSTKSCSSSANCPAGQECIKTSATSGVCLDHTQGDIMTGRVVIGADTYGITPAFLQRHAKQDLPDAIVYLGACRSLWNGSLAVQLFGAGASAVLGYSNYVTNEFAWLRGRELFQTLIDEVGSVLQGAETGVVDGKTGGRLRWIGNGKANAKDGNIINAGWDEGKPTGWTTVGDGRVISRLGATVPVAGKFMGIISTGLGFTAQNGSLEQPFCVAPGATKLCFWWKFYSEEFIEFCGSSYMDRFTATITGKQGKLTVTDVWIDPLCPYDCGGKNPCQPGTPSCKCGSQWKTLDNADVSFDQGGVFMTPWLQDCKEVTPFAGKRVDLKFFVTDTGDSIYDTAVLVDEVTIE